MAKASGLGARLFVDGFNISGDVGSIGGLTGSAAELDVTGIDKAAKERLLGLRDGGIEFSAFWNPGPAADAAHAVLKTLPTADRVVTYAHRALLGAPAASMVGKQMNYDAERAQDGALAVDVQALANGYGREWGTLLTAGTEVATNSLTGQSAGFEGGIGTWAALTNSSVAYSTEQARTGTGSLAIAAVAGGDASARHIISSTSGFPATPGRSYLLQGWLRAATSARTVRMRVSWYDSGGFLVSATTSGDVTDSTSTWTLSTSVVVAPATAAFAQIGVVVTAAGGAAEVHYVDDVSFIPQPAGLDLGTGSTAFGLQAYLHVTAFTGTDATVTLQGSSDDAADAYANITGGAFTSVSAIGSQRIQTARDLTVERYIRPVVTTTGGFSALSYVVSVVRNDVAVVF